jgi:LmbE family N-acetylglucosaminyl deacetylase
MPTVLIIAAHPDDEVLGCGGAMAKHAAGGDTVHTLFLADGVSARPVDGGRAAIDGRKEAAARAAQALGVEPPRFLDLPDNRLDTMALLDVVRPVEDMVAALLPAIIYTHHSGDLNIDHRIAHQATMTACRPLPSSPVVAIYAFEVASSTEWASPNTGAPFRPTRFIDIDRELECKLSALACYEGEMQPFPHSRSAQALEALARWRGASAGVAAAEAFEVLRQIA